VSASPTAPSQAPCNPTPFQPASLSPLLSPFYPILSLHPATERVERASRLAMVIPAEAIGRSANLVHRK